MSVSGWVEMDLPFHFPVCLSSNPCLRGRHGFLMVSSLETQLMEEARVGLMF